ncbi:aldo/keto reductase [Desulfonatronum thiosulfatophilum]|nr:aldo/keto reductase [Desulfonatronum thiosulfatophilum]
MNEIPKIMFGSADRSVTRIGLGGEGVLRTHGRTDEARVVIRTALEMGIEYFDTAPAYSGSEEYLGSVWKEKPERRDSIFHTSKSAQRTYDGAMRDLRSTLSRLGTDYLDLWQIHDVRDQNDIAQIQSENGALRAFLEAREAGTVRHIGVTGHHDPEVLTRCVNEWPLNSVLLPVNPVEGILGGFLTDTLPAAKKRGMAVVGMKVLGGGHYLFTENGLTPERYLRYALSQPVDVVILGCSSPAEVELLVHVAKDFQPMSADEQKELLDLFRPHAERLAYYRGRK